MYVCICNGVTELDIRQAAAAGCASVTELTMRTGCGATCGTCLPMASDLLQAIPLPVLPQFDGHAVEFPVANAA